MSVLKTVLTDILEEHKKQVHEERIRKRTRYIPTTTITEETLKELMKHKYRVDLIGDYFEKPRPDLFETQFKLLERCLNAILEQCLDPFNEDQIDEYIRSLRQIAYECGKCIVNQTNIPTPFVETMINQIKATPIEFLTKYRLPFMNFLTELFMKSYKKSKILKEETELSIALTQSLGGEDKYLEKFDYWPHHIISKHAADCYQLLLEYFVFDLRRNINLKKTSIEEAIIKFLEEEFKDAIDLFTNIPDEKQILHEYFMEHMIVEWEKQYQYQKALQEKLEEILPFPKALCFMIGDKLMGTNQIIIGEASSDVFSFPKPF